MATNNAEIQSMINKDNEMEEKGNENNENDDDDAEIDYDADLETFGSSEKPIIETIKECDNEFEIQLFYKLNEYIIEYEYIFNKGLYIKEMNNDSKQGRALILECGIQGEKSWFIQSIQNEKIIKFSKQKIDHLLQNINIDIG
eukprot:276537_1